MPRPMPAGGMLGAAETAVPGAVSRACARAARGRSADAAAPASAARWSRRVCTLDLPWRRERISRPPTCAGRRAYRPQSAPAIAGVRELRRAGARHQQPRVRARVAIDVVGVDVREAAEVVDLAIRRRDVQRLAAARAGGEQDG